MSVVCPVCEQDVDTSGPGVAEWVVTVAISKAVGDTDWAYVPFIEDWRGSGPTLWFHPRCFVDVHGVDKLVEIIQKREVLNRGEVPRLVRQIRELKAKLPPPDVADGG